jgi:uncharacterized Zn-binding protein involved in type VI secretion
MPGVQRVDDQNVAGGRIIEGDDSVLINGKPVAIDNALVSSHAPYGRLHPPHQAARTRATQSTITANGKQIVINGDIYTCGHVRNDGSTDVSIG